MNFILHAGSNNVDEVVKHAKFADGHGFEAIFFAESQMGLLDPFQIMAVCATKTNRIRLGTGVTSMLFRDPLLLANAAASINEISGGRGILGLGTGDEPELSRSPTPLAQFEQGLENIKQLLQGKSISIRSKRGHSTQIALETGKLPVPLYVSAEGPRTLQLAGRVADAVILGAGLDLRVIQWAKERIVQGAQERGRNPNDIDIIVAGIISVDENGAKARNLARHRLANRAYHNFRSTLETVPPEELAGVKKFMDAFDYTKPFEERVDPNLITEYLVQRFSVAGTPEECVTRVKDLHKAGVRRMMVTPPGSVYTQVTETWATKVMPEFR